MRKSFNRRVLLRGLGGAVVAAPFLSSVAERTAKAQGLPPPPAPKRLIVFFTYNGCLTNRWFPAKSHGPLSKSDYMAMSTLAPMAPYADKLLMVRGIRAMNEWSFEGTLGQMNDPHTQVCGTYFSCHPVTPNAPNSSASNIGKFDAKPTGRTLDHICAEQVNPGGVPPLFIQIGGVNGSSNNTMSVISYDQPGQLFPGYGTPQALFTQLTNLFGPGPISPDSYQAARRKNVIDCVREDLDNLMRVDMSRSDKKKLSDWAELLSQTGKIVTTQCNVGNATKLGLTQESVQAAGSGDLSTKSPVMMDLAVLAAICDANRVIFMKEPPSYVFRFLGINLETISLSHRVGNAGMGGACVTNAIEMIHAVDKWYAQQFAYLVGRLDSITEGDRTLLDNSATVWFNELSDGNAHNLNNAPIIQAGSAGGYFKTGQIINLDTAAPGAANLTAGKSLSACMDGTSSQMINGTTQSTGTDPKVANAPINKYFVNLMNAMGVKAGPDGFAAKGGSAEVTKFGYSDKTEDFIGGKGAVAGATIHSPGEFKELRATP